MMRRVGLAGAAVLGILVAASCGDNGGGGSAQGDDGGGDATSSGSGGSSGASGSSSGSSSSSGASSSSGGSSGGSSSSGSSSGKKGDSGTDSGPPPFDPSVYQHHRNGSRDGLYVDTVFTQAAAATTHVTTFMGTITTDVYAQPLYVENGVGGAETFVVATEDNHVTTYNATTGAVLWDDGPTTGPTKIGAPGPANLPGGSVGSNNVGITGTPYIDIASRTIFFNAMVQKSGSNPYHHVVFAVSLDTGATLPNWPVDLNAVVTDGTNKFDSGIQNQRGALQFMNGVLYVPYGGYDGDGGTYYGSVVGFPVATPQTTKWWHTTAAKGGVWGPGALPTDGTYVYPVTGNTATNPGDPWGGGEAVIRLAAGPTFSGNPADYYAPSNWQSLDGSDTDLGGASEVLVDMPGAQYPHLVVAGGKDGNLYILNRDNLGGVGGELLLQQVGTSEVKGAPASFTTAMGTYVVLHIENGTGSNCPGNQQGNMVVVKITQSPLAATTVWCSTQGSLASPMVTTTDGKANAIVWNSDNALYGWNGDTGAVIVDGTNTGMSQNIQKWNTAIDAKGRIVVGVQGQLYVFTP